MTFFPNVEKIKYEGKNTENPFAFRYYNPEELVLGKSMKDHLRFAVAYWHTFVNEGNDPFGVGVNQRTWLAEDPIKTAKNRVEAAFEFYQKLGVDYFCFHDMDVAPYGDSLETFFKNLDEIVDLIEEKIQEYNDAMVQFVDQHCDKQDASNDADNQFNRQLIWHNDHTGDHVCDQNK